MLIKSMYEYSCNDNAVQWCFAVHFVSETNIYRKR